MNKLFKLKKLEMMALDGLENLLKEGNSSAGSYSNVLPKLRDAIAHEQEKGALKGDKCIRLEFVEPEPREPEDETTSVD